MTQKPNAHTFRQISCIQFPLRHNEPNDVRAHITCQVNLKIICEHATERTLADAIYHKLKSLFMANISASASSAPPDFRQKARAQITNAQRSCVCTSQVQKIVLVASDFADENYSGERKKTERMAFHREPL